MTVQTFITNILADYPNIFSNANTVIWLNRAKNELYKYAGLDTTITIETVAEQAEYDLDSTVEFEHIHYADIEISTGTYVRYTPKTWQERLTGYNFYRTTEGKIAFYPVPTTTGQDITIYYRKKPEDYVSTELTDEIELTEDGLIAAHDYVISMMCRANDDIDKANNYRSDYNSKLLELKQLKYKRAGKYPTTIDVMKRSGTNRRRDRMGKSVFNDIAPRGI